MTNKKLLEYVTKNYDLVINNDDTITLSYGVVFSITLKNNVNQLKLALQLIEGC